MFLLKQPNVVGEFGVVSPRPDLEECHVQSCVNKAVDDGGTNDMSLSTSLGHATESTYPIRYHR